MQYKRTFQKHVWSLGTWGFGRQPSCLMWVFCSTVTSSHSLDALLIYHYNITKIILYGHWSKAY